MGSFTYDVNRYSPLQMVIIPVILFVIALGVVGMTYMTTGMPVKPGIDFTGGTAVTVITTDSTDDIQAFFAGYPLVRVAEGVNNGKYITFSAMDDARLRELSEKISSRYPDAKIDQIGESFGKTLQSQAFLALIFSFIGMAIVVFLVFRILIPSACVVFCAVADILMTAAGMTVVGIPLNLPTTAALLMLIGYSVDSDILLTMRVLKRQGVLAEKLAGAFHTGLIMTSTTIAAVTVMAIVSYIGQVEVIFQISIVLLIGLLFDVVNTWMTNAGLIKWYVLRRGGK